MFGLGVQELFFILLIVLIFFGAEKIPQLAKSLGKGMLEFKKAQQDLKKEILDETVNDPPTRPDTDYVPTMTCPACQKETLAGSQFCSHCGKPLPPIKQCNSCHHELTGNEKFCPGCGQAL